MRKLLLSSFLMLPFLIWATNSTKVNFYKGDLYAVKEMAKAEGKLYVYDFVASWCSPCKLMDETTYTDPTLSQYISENYVVAKVDIDDFDGFALKEKYKVTSLPTILIFNQEGKVVGRYEESMSATKMLDVLKKYNTATNRPTRGATKPTGASPSYKRPLLSDLSKNTTTPKPTTASTPTSNASNKPKESAAKPAATPLSKENKVVYAVGLGLYKMDISRMPSNGFSIQMISLGQYDNVVKTYEDLKIQHPKQPILLYIENIGGKTNYKIMVGEFKTKEAAETYKKSKAPEGYIKDLAKMK
jgi:thioredoxin 1